MLQVLTHWLSTSWEANLLIKDLIPGVIRKLRNREDLTDLIPTYVKKAVLDLTQNYEFDELRFTGPIKNFIINQNEYSRDFFVNPGHGYATFVVSWFVYFDSSVTVGQSTGFPIKYRAPRVVDVMSVIPGLPCAYTQVGEQRNAGNLIVGYMPNSNFATYMRYQRQHPFPDVDENSSQGARVLAQQKIYMPDDWQDLVEYAAAEKALDDIGMTDVGVLFHQKLYGNPSKKMPGLIVERMTQQQRQSEYNERQLRPRVRRY
jgi:hypothetical protein